MAFRELLEGLQASYPIGTSERYRRLDLLERFLEGRQYDHLEHPWQTERQGDYIPMRKRRPAVVYRLPNIVVTQAASLMFGDEQAPTVRCWSEEGDNPFEAIEKSIETIIDRMDLEACMLETAITGSVGSVAIILRATDELEPYWEVVSGKCCKPVYEFTNPNKLIGLVQIYPTKAQDLFDTGYTKEELAAPDQDPDDVLPDHDYWMRIELDAREERRYIPLSAEEYQRLGTRRADGSIVAWVLDKERSAPHHFGVVPAVFIRNLLKKRGLDGECTFEGVTDICIEMDYTISQCGRGIQYSADPLLAVARGELESQSIAGPIGEETQRDNAGGIAKTSSNVLYLENGAKAEMLEITGKGIETGREHVKLLREYAMETMGGMKSEAEHEKGVQSGKALEKLWEALRLLVKRLRIPYGNRGLLPLLRLIMTGIQNGAITVEDVGSVDPKAPMRLIWPRMSIPHGADLQAEAAGLQLLAGQPEQGIPALLPRKNIVLLAANATGLTDGNAVLQEWEKQAAEDEQKVQEKAENDAKLQAMAKAHTRGADGDDD